LINKNSDFIKSSVFYIFFIADYLGLIIEFKIDSEILYDNYYSKKNIYKYIKID